MRVADVIAYFIGYVAGRRSPGDHAMIGASVAIAVMLTFMAASLPHADWMNACFIGETLVLDLRGCL